MCSDGLRAFEEEQVLRLLSNKLVMRIIGFGRIELLCLVCRTDQLVTNPGVTLGKRRVVGVCLGRGACRVGQGSDGKSLQRHCR